MKRFFFLTVLVLFCFSCDDSDDGTVPNPFSLSEDGSKFYLNGEVGTNSLSDFNTLYSANPNVNSLHIISCEGSLDDDANFLLMQRVYDLAFSTHLEDNAIIASGGVDLFRSGVIRTRGENIQIGVHSWEDGSSQASDYSVGDSVHTPYINSYISIGMTEEEATSFYFFTINAASAASIHWMTEQEMVTYSMFTD